VQSDGVKQTKVKYHDLLFSFLVLSHTHAYTRATIICRPYTRTHARFL